MAYTPNVWRDGPAGRTPITAALLARIENGLSAVAALTDTLLERINAVKSTADGNAVKVKEHTTALQAASAALAPIGAVVPFWGLQEPAGWLLCKGQAVSRATYKELFAVIGVRSGAGDGSTTFNVPDLRGRVVYGVGDSGSFAQTMGASVGSQQHKLTVDELPSHRHEITKNDDPTKYWSGYGSPQNSGSGWRVVNMDTSAVNDRLVTGYTGGGKAFDVLPPGVVANYIIRAK